MVELLPSKQDVAGSSPVSRSRGPLRGCRLTARRDAPNPADMLLCRQPTGRPVRRGCERNAGAGAKRIRLGNQTAMESTGTLRGAFPFIRSRVLASAARTITQHWGALLALLLFLAVGLAALDDYGITWDEPNERGHPIRTLWFIQGENTILTVGHNKFYGVAFQMPLLLAERVLGLEDSRAIYLSRHLLTHLLFLASGLFAYLLAYRLFGNRLIALFAMLLYLLHPRLYAHSFANGRDLPFASALMISLYLTHRAFRRDTLPAFALLGVAVGALVNLRIMGVVLLAAVPAMGALDFVFARGRAERKRAVAATGAFALAALLTTYALLPYLWADPVGRAIEGWTVLSNHPHLGFDLFRGTRYYSDDLPADYLPGWISITSPPFALLLGLLGGIVGMAGMKATRSALRNRKSRFALLVGGCFLLPILAVILLRPNIYDGWRQAYFLWAPFSLLGAYGLRWLVSASRTRGLRAAVYGAAGAGAAATAASIALLHPSQQDTFNFFVDRVEPEHLRTQYLIGYWSHPTRQALEWALNQGSYSPVSVNVHSRDRYYPYRTAQILPREVRERLSFEQNADALVFTRYPPREEGRELRAVKVYGSTTLSIQRKADLRQVYALASSSVPILSSAFDLHAADGSLIYVKEPCGPSDIEGTFRLQVFPEDEESLPDWWRDSGQEDIRFYFPGYGAAFDGKCVAVVPLPDYPVAAVRASQFREWGRTLWESEGALDVASLRDALRDATRGDPLARPAFDIYLMDGDLVYSKDPCGEADIEARFFLQVFPRNPGDLPDERRGRGYESLDFDFFLKGSSFDGKCAAMVPLPDYEIEAIATGQRMQGVDLWREEFSLQEDERREALRRARESAPVARSVFDLYLTDGELLYVREACGPNYTEARFFLHILPARRSDLPEERRQHGFDNLDFNFFLNGARFDGTCVARVALPDYEIREISTGQYTNTGAIWMTGFAFPE